MVNLSIKSRLAIWRGWRVVSSTECSKMDSDGKVVSQPPFFEWLLLQLLQMDRWTHPMDFPNAAKGENVTRACDVNGDPKKTVTFRQRRRHGWFRVSDYCIFRYEMMSKLSNKVGGWDPTSFCFEGMCHQCVPEIPENPYFFSRSQWCWVGDWAESITRNIVDFFSTFWA